MTTTQNRKKDDAKGNGRGLAVSEILTAAADVFSTKGYEGTNLNDVAERLGVKRQALYYYFPHKHEILFAIFSRIYDEFERSAAQAVEGITDPVERFRALLRAYYMVVTRDPKSASIAVQEYRSLPSKEEKLIRMRRQALIDMLIDAYRLGVEAGRLRDIDSKVAVYLLMGAGNWMHQWFRPQGKLAIGRMAELAEAMFFEGYAVHSL